MKKVFLASNFAEFKELRVEIKNNSNRGAIEIIDLNDNSADSRSPLARSLEEAKNVDYFILLLGESYGRVHSEDNKSITHKEFELATEKGLHILIYLEERLYSDNNLKLSNEENFFSFQSEVISYESTRSLINFSENHSEIARKINQDLMVVALRNKDEKIVESIKSNLTRSDEIIGFYYNNRKLLIDSNSDKNKESRFGLWEVNTPHKAHVLLIHKVSSPILLFKLVMQKIKLLRLNIELITILRADNISSNPFNQAIKDYFPNKGSCLFYKLNDFINEYCIGISDFSEVSSSTQGHLEEFFKDQPVFEKHANGYKEKKNALSYFNEEFLSENNNSHHLMLGDPGNGKTSFCVVLAKNLNSKKEGEYKKTAILLSFQNIKNGLKNEGETIKSLYDLYVFFQKNSKQTQYPNLTKVQFEISVFCGNLIIIVDGLDEIATFFGSKFQKDYFIESIQEMNEQLHSSNVLLSSRKNVFNINNQNNIDTKYLLGFNRNLSLKYFKNRFKQGGASYEQHIIDKYETLSNSAVRKFDSLLKDFNCDSQTDTLPPYVIDLVSMLYEDDENGSFQDSDISYYSNGEFKDKIIYDFINREIGKQTSPIKTVEDYLEILFEIAVECGNSISNSAIKEYCVIYHDQQAQAVLDLLGVSPLLIKDSFGSLKFKYDFLEKYFLYLYIVKNISENMINDSLIKVMSKSVQEQDTYLKVEKYFQNNPPLQLNEIFQDIVIKLKQHYLERKQPREGDGTHHNNVLLEKEKNDVKNAINFIVKLFIGIVGSKEDNHAKSTKVLDFFTENNNVKYLFISGNLIPFDFSNRNVVYCEFNFEEFGQSNFNSSHFSYCLLNVEKFTLPSGVADSTCTVNGSEAAEAISGSELLKDFFNSNFYQEGQFSRRKTLSFPLSGLSIRSSFFKRLTELKIVAWDKDSAAWQVIREKDVNSWFVNNRSNAKLQKVIVSLDKNIKDIRVKRYQGQRVIKLMK